MSSIGEFLKNAIATKVARWATDASGNVTGLVGPRGGLMYLDHGSAHVSGGGTEIDNAIVPLFVHSHSGPAFDNHVWGFGDFCQPMTITVNDIECDYWVSSMGEYDLIPSTNLKSQTICDYRGVLFASDGDGAGRLGKMYRSDDNGATWATLTESLNLSDATGLLWVCAHSSNRSSAEPYMFAYETNESTIYRLIRSVNGGSTWATVKDLADLNLGYGAGAYDCAVLPMGFCEDATNGNLYFATYQTTPNEAAIFKSTDSGATWAEIFNSRSTVVSGHFPDVTTQHVHGLYVAAAGDIIYAGTDAAANCRLIKSEDAGATWSVITGAAAAQWDLARCVEFNGHRFFGTGDGGVNAKGASIYKTADDSTFNIALTGAHPCNNLTADSDSLWAYALGYGKWRYPAIYRTIDGLNFKQVWIGDQDTTTSFAGYARARNSSRPAEQQRQTLVGSADGAGNYPPLRLLSGQGRSMALVWVKIPTLPADGALVTVYRATPSTAKASAAEVFLDKYATADDGLIARFLLSDNVADGGAVVDSIAGNNGIFDTYNGSYPTTFDSSDGAPTFIFYPRTPRFTPCLYNKEGVEDSGGVRFGDVAAFNALTADPSSDSDGFALAAWIKIPSSGVATPGGISSIIAKGYGTTSQMWSFGLSSSGYLAFSVLGTSVNANAATPAIDPLRDGLWHLVGVNVVNSDAGVTSLQFAIDGILLNASSPQSLPAEIPSPHVSGKNLGIGSAFNGSTPVSGLQGRIQDARIYSHTLNAAEWRELFELRPAI